MNLIWIGVALTCGVVVYLLSKIAASLELLKAMYWTANKKELETALEGTKGGQ